jgi:integrase
LTDGGIRKLRPLKGRRRELPDASCPGLYLAIYESGIKSFTLRYKKPGGGGKSVRLTLGRFDPTGHEVDGEPQIGDPLTLRGARLLVAQLQRDRKRGKDPAAQNRLSRTMEVQKADNHFGSAARQFVEEYKISRSDVSERRPRGWRETARLLGWSYPTDERDGKPEVIRGSLVDRWRDRPVGEIDAHEIAAVIDESRRHGIPGLGRHNQGLSSNRARKVHDVLHVMFSWLQDQHRVVANPVAGLRRPRPPASRDRVLNTDPKTRGADELRFFWGACSEIGQPWEVLFKLLLLVGARRDEIGQLKWSELNDDRTAILLEGSRTKNSRPLHLDLPPLATKLIASVEPVSEKYVFSIAGYSAIAGYAKAKRRLDAAMTALARAERGEDATIEPFRLHDLRRTCATGMASIGVEPHHIEATLNHISGFRAGIAGTYNREQYSKEKAAALVRWSEHVERVATGQTAKVVPIGRKGSA